MKNSILTLILLLIGLTGFSTIITINNSGMTFTPSSITISYGDSVAFKIGATHNVIEVSASIWEVNESSPLLGGFQLPKGGGLLTPIQLAEGTHYYICEPHISMGMKGAIQVLGPTRTAQNIPQPPLSLFPNPTQNLLSIRISADLVGTPFSILDITGKIVLTGRLENEEFQLFVEDFENGIYFLRSDSAISILQRFIKN